MKRIILHVFIAAFMLLAANIPGVPTYALSEKMEYSVSESKTSMSPGEIEGMAAAPGTADYSGGSNASLRMKPLKEMLAALTQADIDREAAKYGDIKAHWSKLLVSKLSTTEIIKGYSDGTFKPENPVTVAEFVTMTVKALGYKLELDNTYWAKNFIDRAIEDSLFSKGEFADYNRPVTREEVAGIAVNAAMKYDAAPAHEMDNVVKVRVKDFASIKDSNKQKVIDANLLGLMSVYGSTGRFMPQNKLTRAEAATVILRLLDESTRLKLEPKETEMIKITSKYDGTVHYLTNTGKPETLPFAYKIIEATKKSKGYVEITNSVNDEGIGIWLWDSKEKADNNMIGNDVSISIALNGGDFPYDIIIRNAPKTKELHLEVIKDIFKMFYEKDADKVIAQFTEMLNAAIEGSEKFYQTWTYKTGIKFNNRGIRLARGSYDPELLVWIYSK